jgi:predicted transcriptional regulator
MTRTLHIQIGKRPDRNDLDERLGAIDAGEEIEPRPSRLSIASLDTFGRIFRPTNLELLKAIGEHNPDSIRELARLVDRHPPEVTENAHELHDYGLIELVEDGRALKPTLWYDEIEFSGDIPLAGLDDGSEDTAAIS